jgi:valyl-tRNA synthetase
MDMFCAQKQPFEVLHTNDAWILSELSITTTLAKEAFDAFDYAKAKSIIEDFFWFKLCDSYIESIKKMMYDASTYPSGSLASAQQTLSQVVCATLKLFSPFIPFATEAMYQYYIAKDLRKSIHVLSWDTVALDQTALVQGRLVHDLLGATRRYKAGKNMPLNTPIEPALLISCSASDFAVFSAFSAIICGTVSALLVSHSPEPLGEVASFSLNSIEVLAPLASKK